MRTQTAFLVAVLSVCSCGGGGASTPQDRLVGTWMHTNATGGAATGITFNADGTYSYELLQVTSANSANVEAETGVFEATDTELTTTPGKWSCPGPDPVATVTYKLNGDSLQAVSPSAIVVFSRDTEPASTNAQFTIGCFQADGSFVPAPLAAVSNQ